MKRSSFLALIPSLSAIPLIGKEIIQKSDRIEIYQPEQVKEFTVPETDKPYVAIVHKGRIVATGILNEVTLNHPMSIDTSYIDNSGAQQYIRHPRECTFEGHITSPINDEVHEAVLGMFSLYHINH